MTMMTDIDWRPIASRVGLAAFEAICNNYLRIPSECANFARRKK